MKDGVEYVLRFGDLRLDTSGKDCRASDADASRAAADKAKAGDKSVQRYLFAMARFNENAIKKPVLEELPPLPTKRRGRRRDHRHRNAAGIRRNAEAKADDAKAPIEEEEEEEETPETAEPKSPEASSLQRAGESPTHRNPTTPKLRNQNPPTPNPPPRAQALSRIRADPRRAQAHRNREPAQARRVQRPGGQGPAAGEGPQPPLRRLVLRRLGRNFQKSPPRQR